VRKDAHVVLSASALPEVVQFRAKLKANRGGGNRTSQLEPYAAFQPAMSRRLLEIIKVSDVSKIYSAHPFDLRPSSVWRLLFC
jgi:hypothetical protein